MRHRAFRIEPRRFLKRANRRAVIEAVKKGEALIEIALRLWRIGRDLARIGTESVEERLFRGARDGVGQCERRQENDSVKKLGRRFHKKNAAETYAHRIRRGKPIIGEGVTAPRAD